MGIRERLNENRGVTVALASTLVALAVVWIVVQILASRKRFPTSAPDAYFSVDDGKTWFAASSDNVPPFDHEGKPAVRAYVYECAGKRFVAYLERYTPQAHKIMVEEKQRLANLPRGKPSPPNGAVIGADISGRELKKPGDPKWVRSTNPGAAAKVTDVQCPFGTRGTPEPVAP
jgi:hypothetical protein